MKQFIISEELAQALLNYMGQQKYVDAAPLIQGLMSLELIETKESEDSQPKEVKK